VISGPYIRKKKKYLRELRTHTSRGVTMKKNHTSRFQPEKSALRKATDNLERDNQGGNFKPSYFGRDQRTRPAEADPDIWHLALVFEGQAVREDGPAIRLITGPVLIYDDLRELVETFKFRDKYQEPSVTPVMCAQMFEDIRRLHWPQPGPGPFTKLNPYPLDGPVWRQFFELIIVEFWTRYQGADGIRKFSRGSGAEEEEERDMLRVDQIGDYLARIYSEYRMVERFA
jgi:hypothetical protein